MKIMLALVLFLALAPSAMAEIVFPASYSIKVVTKDYHLNIRPLSDKAIMRVTKDILIDVATNKEFYPYFRKMEIIDKGNVIYQDSVKIYNYQDPTYELADCRIFKGKSNDYFAYSFDSWVGSAEHSIQYQILRIIQKNNQYEIIKFEDFLPSNTPAYIVFSNEEIPINNLDEGKYKTIQYYDGRLNIESKLEFTDTTLEEVDKDFRIIQTYNIDMTLMYNKNARKEAGSINLYPTYKLENKAQTISLSEKSTVDILGGRHVYGNIYSFSDTSIHVIIDGHEGWVTLKDYMDKLGFH